MSRQGVLPVGRRHLHHPARLRARRLRQRGPRRCRRDLDPDPGRRDGDDDAGNDPEPDVARDHFVTPTVLPVIGAGASVTVQHGRWPVLGSIARYAASVLAERGYQADVRPVPDDVGDASDPYFDAVQLMVPLGWVADYPSPGTFYGYVGTCQKKTYNRHCNTDVEATAAQARALARTDPSGALATWARLDRMLVERAVVIPTDTQVGTVVVSPDVGNVLLRPINGPILDQMWVR